MSVTLLDGSIGQELVRRLGETPTPLWSTRVMMERPDMVEAIHRDYFEAGAEIATIASYPLLRNRLENNGIADQFEALHHRAREIGMRARDAHGSGQVASALGPLGASYRPDLAPPVADGAKEYAEIVALHDDEVDLHLIETASGLRLAESALMGCAGAVKPVWLAVSVSDADGTLLRSGEPLVEVLPLLDTYQPAAILVNCSLPEVVGQSLEIIAEHGLPFGAYANGFTQISDAFKVVQQTVDTLEARTDLGPAAYADFTDQWIDMGATIIGGCCEIGRAHISEIANRLRVNGEIAQ